jgi:hypothetical protein
MRVLSVGDDTAVDEGASWVHRRQTLVLDTASGSWVPADDLDTDAHAAGYKAVLYEPLVLDTALASGSWVPATILTRMRMQQDTRPYWRSCSCSILHPGCGYLQTILMRPRVQQDTRPYWEQAHNAVHALHGR